jgi:hypothetical protein
MNPHRLEAEVLAAPWYGAEALAWARRREGGAVLSVDELAALVAPRVYRLDPQADVSGLVRRLYGHAPRPLDALVRHARRLLCSGPGGLVLALDGEAPHGALLRWRWLTLRLPSALLICAAWLDHLAEPPARVLLLDRTLAPTGPVAHLHVHQGNVADFERVWVGLARFGLPLTLAKASSAPTGWMPTTWARCLAGALVARRLLFAALNHRGGLPTLTAAIQRVWPEPHWHPVARMALAALREPEAHTLSLSELNALIYATPDGPPPHAEGSTPLPPHPMLSGECADERRLLRHLLARLSGDAGDEPAARPWRTLLLALLRVKGSLFTHLTHDVLVPSLSAFTVTSNNFKPYAKWLGRHRFETANLAAAESPALQLREQDFREGPPKNTRDLFSTIDSHTAYERAHGVATTLTFHLIRHQSNDDPHRDGLAWQRERLSRSAGYLSRALQEWPRRLLPHVRGLDLAGDERRGPLWLAAPVLRRLRRLADRLSRQHRVPTLGLTVHVGEDWHHLISGLRAVDEPLTWGLLRPGERLGHAFALGLDSDAWLSRHPIATDVPLQVRLLDLAWLLHATQRLATPALSARAHAWEAEAQELLRSRLNLAPADGALQALVNLWRYDLHDGRWQDGVFDLDRPLVPGLTGRFMTWLRGERWPPGQSPLDAPVTVNAAEDGPALLEVRRDLLQRLANMRITIEVNPTSNMLIGGLERPLDQPMFRLHPLAPSTDGTGDPVVAVCLNADDPLAFATTLSDEFAYTWAGLMAAGQPPAVIADWLDRAAAASWRARFGAPQRV